MAPDWIGNSPGHHRTMETVPVASSDLGWDARQFRGPHSVVVAYGECARCRAHGSAGAAWERINRLRSDSGRIKLRPVHPSHRCDRRGSGSHNRTTSDCGVNCLGGVRLHRTGDPATFMGKSGPDLVFFTSRRWGFLISARVGTNFVSSWIRPLSRPSRSLALPSLFQQNRLLIPKS